VGASPWGFKSPLRHKIGQILPLTCTFAGATFCGDLNRHGQGVELDIAAPVPQPS